jgi:solute carrier family 25 (mitochondrial phosphate transporter), member 23/24/25/41
MEGEDQRAQDERVERLWQDLDTQGEGKLSLQGLRRGLRKMDHRRL